MTSHAASGKWGPLVPCVILGMVFAGLLTSPISSSPEEDVFKLLGVPLIGAVIGLLVGLVWDITRTTASKAIANHPSDSPGASIAEQTNPADVRNGSAQDGPSTAARG